MSEQKSNPLATLEALHPESLRSRCDVTRFEFETTAELQPLTDTVGQERALEALRFAIGIRRDGYNVYALGPPGVGKHALVRSVLERECESKEPPLDWCYVNNFEHPDKPIALSLSAGHGVQFRDDIEQLIEELGVTLSATFESEEYKRRVEEIEAEFKELQERSFSELQRKAEQKQTAILSTPHGYAVAPLHDGEVLQVENYEKLSEEEQQRAQSSITSVQAELAEFLKQLPGLQKKHRAKLKALRREFTMAVVGQQIDELREKYAELPGVLDYLDDVERDVVENARDFVADAREDALPLLVAAAAASEKPHSFTRYKVNLIVDHSGAEGAPLYYEDNPTYPNLVGRVEHVARLGALVADFTLIKPGALHLASGGYLLIDARKLLVQPYAWDGLKRALFSGKINMQSIGGMLGVLSTSSLDPEPIPLDVRVVLLGDRLLYYLLCALDLDFRELFKVAADFDDRIGRDENSHQLYARWIATISSKERLLPLDRSAVGRVIEESSRWAQDAERLSTQMRSLTDLLCEADHEARQANRAVVESRDVASAIGGQIRRADRVRNRIHEEIRRGTILIDTDGEKIGQVNGLSVIQLGDFAFGQPSRITATARLGKGEVVDVQREVDLGGSIHSKGVLILSAFLASRYSENRPLSLTASLVFEQSYGLVEGDSASVAELCALLSVLADAPIKQSLAITGSVNQRGEVQAIGGVNEKIEGFYDVCRVSGAEVCHGVLIPSANVKHLMLRGEVVDAAEKGKFQVYAVETVDEAISILTGVPAGVRGEDGSFPEGTLNFRVEERMAELAAIAKRSRKDAEEPDK